MSNTTADNVKVSVTMHDLTKMFGSDEQIAAALGVSVADITSQAAVDAFERLFPADYYPYNAGELLNVNADGIKATDPVLGTSTVDISSWQHLKDPSDPTKLLFPYGLCSAGDVRDEVTATQAIKRVDSSGSTYTALSTPVMVDLPRRQDYSYPVSLSTTESVVPDNSLLSVGWNQMFNPTSIPSSTKSYITFTNNGDGSFTVQGTSTSQAVSTEVTISSATHVFLFKGEGIQLRRSGTSQSTNVGHGYIYNNSSSYSLSIRFRVSGETTVNYTTYVQCFDLTAMYGSGNEPQTVAEFEAMFPADYYPYNAGQQLYLYPTKSYPEIPASPSAGETKPYTAPVITTNTYSGFDESAS